jgi:NADH:ubiquinone oxidoreductase subunit H
MKEETLPAHVNKPIFMLAPMLAFIPALMAAAVIPFGAPWDSRWGRIPMVIADLPVGFLFILAITSLGVYGIVLAGWSSNNKYALLGGLRSSAQMISYEIAMGMSLIPVLLLAGNVMEPSSIVLIMAPILFPVAMKLGIDPIHFGIMMVVNMEVGMCHPPVGLNLYVASGITNMGITELTIAVWPWLLTMLVFLGVVTYWPALSIWLPKALGMM